MSNQKHHESMKNLERCYDAVLQSSTKGISAVEISKKIGMHKTMVHRNLNTLELMRRVESQHGVWRVKAREHTTRPLKKEIVIELPMPKDQLQIATHLELLAKDSELHNHPTLADVYRTMQQKIKETRTITIKGKNVDDLDLEKVGKLIQQANEKGSKLNFRGLFKSLKRSRANDPQKE